MFLIKNPFSLKFFVFFSLIVLSSSVFFENKPLTVENRRVVLSYHLIGGGLKDFHLKSNPVNPYSKSSESATEGGHFMSFATFNGEEWSEQNDNSLMWDLSNSPILRNRKMQFLMRGDFINNKITVKRSVKLDTGNLSFYVNEEFFNYDVKDKSLKISQNISLGPSFMEDFKIFSNLDVPTSPKVLKKRNLVEKMNDSTNVSWITIVNFKDKILLGYVWDPKDYNSISFKNQDESYSLTFSTGETDQKIASKSAVFKKYFCFILPLSKDFKGIAKLQVKEGEIFLTEKGNDKVNFSLGKANDFLSQR